MIVPFIKIFHVCMHPRAHTYILVGYHEFNESCKDIHVYMYTFGVGQNMCKHPHTHANSQCVLVVVIVSFLMYSRVYMRTHAFLLGGNHGINESCKDKCIHIWYLSECMHQPHAHVYYIYFFVVIIVRFINVFPCIHAKARTYSPWRKPRIQRVM